MNKMLIKNEIIYDRFEATNEHLLELAKVCYQKSNESKDDVLVLCYYRDPCSVIVKKYSSILLFSELEILISFKDKKSREQQLTLIIASNSIDVYKCSMTKQNKTHIDWIGEI